MNPGRVIFQVWLYCCTTLACVAAQNQAPVPSPSSPPAVALPNDANQYVRDSIRHEITELNNDHSHWRYLLHREEDRYSFDRDAIETQEGNISRTVLWNGRPLTTEERQKDEERMQRLLTDPAEKAKHGKREKEDYEKAHKMLAAIPDAFIFQYDGDEDGLVRLTFTPNPRYSAPNRELQVFHSLKGRMWIDRSSSRLARIDGTLFEDVLFGLGLLGRLNKGGTFHVVQQQVAPGHWEVVLLEVKMSGHAVIFKTINVRQLQQFSNFKRMPDSLTLSQAYDMLRNEPSSASATNGANPAPSPQNRN